MDRTCALCGTSFEAKRATARYCSGSCRARWAKGERPVVEVGSPTTDGAVAAAVRRELSAVARLDSALGQAALRLAGRLDAGEAGSAAASVTRELRATLADALKGAKQAQSPVEAARDELARRRAARGA